MELAALVLIVVTGEELLPLPDAGTPDAEELAVLVLVVVAGEELLAEVGPDVLLVEELLLVSPIRDQSVCP